MLFRMPSIVTDGDAEPKLALKDGSSAQGKRQRGRFGFGAGGASALRSRQFAVLVAVVTTLLCGGWLLVRGAALWLPETVDSGVLLPLPYPAAGGGEGVAVSVAALLCGAALLLAAAGFADGRRWAWTLMAGCALLTTTLAIAATLTSGVVDWAGLFVGFAVSMVVALPNVREV